MRSWTRVSGTILLHKQTIVPKAAFPQLMDISMSLKKAQEELILLSVFSSATS